MALPPSRHPMFSRLYYKVVIVLLIASTLTCNLVMVAFLRDFFYGSLKVSDPASLHRVASSLGAHGRLAYKDFREVVDETDAFDAIAGAMIQRGQPVYAGPEAHWMDVAWATGAFGDVIRTDALEGGRFLAESEDDPGAAKVAVVNRSTWERLRPGQPFDSGAQIVVSGASFEVVGVVRNAFPFLDSMDDVEVWIPARQNPLAWQYEVDDYQEYQILARLDPKRRAIAEQQLDAALADIDRRLGFSYTADVLSETEFRIRRNPGMHRLFVALLVVSGFLFVLGAVNQLLMLVTRSVAIGADLKVMVALGARGRHVLLRFARGFAALLAVALAGSAAASAAALQLYNHAWGAQFGAVGLERLLEPLPLGLLGGLTVLLVLLHLGFPTLMYLLRGDSLMVRDRGAGSRFSMRSILSVAGVAGQIGIVTFTVLGSGAFLQSLGTAGSVRVGPYDDRLVAVELAFASREAESAPQFRARLDAIESALTDLGGIEAMGASNALPLHPGGWTRALVEGQPVEKDPEWIAFDLVTPGYFETLGLEIIEGVDFQREEAVQWPHRRYVVNQAYARKHFAGQQVLGRNIAPWDGVGYGPIVGVVEDSPLSTGGDIRPCIYIPSYQSRFILNIRLSDSSLARSHLGAIVERIKAADPEVIVVNVDTLETIWEKSLAAPRLGFYILTALSLVALALAMSGAFGYQTYTMMLRQREFAIRHALGQSSRAIYWSEARRGLWTALAGLAVGIAGFYAALRVFGAYFFDLGLSTLGAAAMVLCLVAAFAAVVSAASLASARPKLAMLMRE